MKILMLGPFMLIAYTHLKATALGPVSQCIYLQSCMVLHPDNACVLDEPLLLIAPARFVLLLAGVTTLERPSEQNGSSVTAFRFHLM